MWSSVTPFIEVDVRRRPIIISRVLVPVAIRGEVNASFPLLRFKEERVCVEVRVFCPTVYRGTVRVIPNVVEGRTHNEEDRRLVLLRIVSRRTNVAEYPLVPAVRGDRMAVIMERLYVDCGIRFIVRQELVLGF